MVDPPRPSGVDADEHGREQRPRHLRIDERPAVRDLDDAQLAAEALTALRAEHQAPPEPERVGIVPWDPPSRSPAATAPDASSGRHRADDRPIAFSSGSRVAGGGRRTVGAPKSGPAHPGPSSSRDDHVLVTARSGLRPHGAPESAPRRSWRSRPLLMAVAVAILAGVGVLVFVLVRSPADGGAPAGGPVVSVGTPAPTVGTPAPTVDASAPVAPTTRTAASTADSTGDIAELGRASAGSSAGATSTTGSVVLREADAERTPPAPAVLSTLAPGDTGFGWPTTAFGQPR